jgi:hypothetical protein
MMYVKTAAYSGLIATMRELPTIQPVTAPHNETLDSSRIRN